MSLTIKQLRQTGYKVRVLHTRNYKIVKKMDGFYEELLAKGGSTTIEITTPDRAITVSSTSVCSEVDNFDRKLGNSIALGRALTKLNQ
jgi:hypothetical protein